MRKFAKKSIPSLMAFTYPSLGITVIGLATKNPSLVEGGLATLPLAASGYGASEAFRHLEQPSRRLIGKIRKVI